LISKMIALSIFPQVFQLFFHPHNHGMKMRKYKFSIYEENENKKFIKFPHRNAMMMKTLLMNDE
jgi:hypothetical protein